MIVRSLQLNGRPYLLLIPQSIHAALSGDLASNWGRRPFLPLVAPETIWPAIFHHDDGWIDPDRAPVIDPDTRRPESFLETPAERSHEIWSDSIQGAGRIGTLAQYVIATHFLMLREQSESATSPAGKLFIEQCESRCRHWKADLQAASAPLEDAALDLAVRQLRFFDWLSLWFCLGERLKPHTFEQTPGDLPLTVTPRPGGVFEFDPWPWTVSDVHVAVSGHLVPDRAFADTSDVQSQMTDWCKLEWHLIPAD